jgi:uncharacterized protein (TIGR03083 family)
MAIAEKTVRPTQTIVLDHLVAERQELLTLCRDLVPDEWEKPSLCEGWRVRDVVAHLVSIQVDWLLYFTGSGDKVNQKLVDQRQALPLETLVEQLAGSVEPNRAAKLMSSGFLYDNWVHQQDIRWVLGENRQRHQDAERQLLILNGLRKPAARKKKGIAFSATDLNWQSGEGQPVSGPAEAVIMALADRPASLQRLTGQGVEVLADLWRVSKS